MATRCFIFLGNPGKEYEKTRHNVGWMAADALAQFLPAAPNWQSKFDGSVASSDFGALRCYWFKPQTFMNLSGEAARKIFDFYKLSLADLVVVHDELELPFGTVQFKSGGGAGGHNGLRSLDKHLGGNAYLRCRIGIGRPRHGDVSNFVLSRFTSEEEISLPLVAALAGRHLADLARGKAPPTAKLEAFQNFEPRR